MMTKRVFITGIGMITPLGLDTTTTWQNLVAGKSGAAPIEHFDPTEFQTQIACEVKDFDATNFIDRKKARQLDRFSQFAMSAAQEALAQSNLNLENTDLKKVGVIIASGIGGISTLDAQATVLNERGPKRISPFLIPMMLPDMASGQISMALGTQGPNFCVVSSCSSGAEALGNAWKLINNDEAEIVIAGGAEAPICPLAVAGFNACQALSTNNENPTFASRPFDIDRDGFVMGEGSSVLILESEESIIKRDAQPLAELVGYGATSDAFHVTQPHPEGAGAIEAMRRALSQANLEPSDIDYINAHGTSTPLNDKFETMAIKKVYMNSAYSVPISSTKSMTGHLLGAGAALEAAFSVLSIQNGTIPPTINLTNQDPDCDLDFTANNSIQKDISNVMSNSLGFGGHNSSLIFKKV
ncbi:MAG: beta-ketoacyl-ACP synthase II [SAR202 cluster bacterium]|nr:beta-ketoacyl-[acyl-carrier-protein] synthase II [Chloroflexota bacterium]MBA67011.1 beta-ketoacyl-[acyl-carrier-protein] synthase II [Chloroflexota bacterium]MCH2523112.1 beta-ketoacyl-ACP synthase II [Dehalococcoidia bacterium]MQG25123.1 beta-ketoacyl-ACP synthase II [SAR202 cluster bacterium]MQG84581.1 beta-ketoacyl-ACP synthase II [SAR202 cluster bacterium]